MRPIFCIVTGAHATQPDVGVQGRASLARLEESAHWCEAYGWIVEHASGRTERMARGKDFAQHFARVGDDRVEPAELADIVREACEARNGWKVILRRCSPVRRPRAGLLARVSPPTALAGA